MAADAVNPLQAWREAGGVSAPAITNPILRYRAKPTPRRAIAAKCAECMGCTAEAIEPGYRTDIRNCTSRACPLWEWRPYQAADDTSNDSAEVRDGR